MANTGSMAAVGCLLLHVTSSYETQPAEIMNPLLFPNATRIWELNSLVRIGYLGVGSEELLVSFLLISEVGEILERRALLF